VAAQIKKQQQAYVLRFRVLQAGCVYGERAASAVLDALRDEAFTGRCEYYAGEVGFSELPIYVVALVLRAVGGANRLDLESWSHIAQRVAGFLAMEESGPTLALAGSEVTDLATIRAHLASRGSAKFEAGYPVSILRNQDSWFIAQVEERLAKRAGAIPAPANST
jgi:hypothetical protein